MKERLDMSSRRLRSSAAVLVFAAVLLPATALNAAQGLRHQPAATKPVTVNVAVHHPLIEFLMRLFFEAGPGLDGNGRR
jgi:hypothetical protein